jgi:TonB family protein
MRGLVVAGLIMVMLGSGQAAFGKSKERPAQQTAGYISDADYPASAIRNGQAGTVTAKFTVGKNGVVKDCIAGGLESSPALMTQTCNLITRRFRFSPELNKKGKPVETLKTIRISWRLPVSGSGVDIVPSGMGRDVALRLTVTSEGQVIRCEKDTGYDWADYYMEDICALFIKRYSPRPVKVVDGKPVPQVERALITVRVN